MSTHEVRGLCGRTTINALEFFAKVKVGGMGKDRKGLTRSAMFLIFFVTIHGLGNVHVFKGPDDFNGYGYTATRQ